MTLTRHDKWMRCANSGEKNADFIIFFLSETMIMIPWGESKYAEVFEFLVRNSYNYNLIPIF